MFSWQMNEHIHFYELNQKHNHVASIYSIIYYSVVYLFLVYMSMVLFIMEVK